jgi:transcriptional regulator with GAF, ATPase, and Fis domain
VVWVSAAASSSSDCAKIVSQLLQALRARGLDVTQKVDRSPGCLVTDAITSSLLGEITERAGDGTEIIALAIDRDSLGPQEVWRLLHAGADDVLAWSGMASVEHVESRLRRRIEVERLVQDELVRDRVCGRSLEWLGTLRRVVETARYSSAPVLITGESGTGKELLAQLVHDLDPRAASGLLVVVDCTTITPTLLGSELFGHERGAFTGAVSTRIGAVAGADGGTLLLDEVGELPLELQPALLRVVQEGTYKRVGSDKWLQTSFRLVCATNRDLRAAVAAGTFRQDLYYRIAAAVIGVPPLRQRMDDVVPLFRHFLAEQMPGSDVELTPAVRDFLLTRDYPGNVRDLRQLALRVAARHVGDGAVTPGDIPPAERPSLDDLSWNPVELETPIRKALASGASLDEVRRATVDLAYRVALADEGSSRAAGERLRVTERAVQLWQKGSRPRWPDRGDGRLAAVGGA